jgi:hypothetical protein
MVSTARSSSAPIRLSLTPFIAGIASLVVGHVAIVFFLYGSRAFVRSLALPSEFVVFLFPAAVAFTGYYLLLRARASSIMPSWVAAFLLTLFSFSLSLVLAFNTHGT